MYNLGEYGTVDGCILLGEDAMAEAGLLEMETYVSRRQNKAAQFITTRPIIYLCLAAYRSPRSRMSKQWCYQEGLDLKGMRMADR